MIYIFADNYAFGEHYARYERSLAPGTYKVTTRPSELRGLCAETEVYVVVAPRHIRNARERQAHEEARLILHARQINYVLAYLS